MSTLARVRYEWCVCKSGVETVCEIWSDGAIHEARLVRSEAVIIRDRSRSEDELRREQRHWLTALESLGWQRRPAPSRTDKSYGAGRAVALKS
jgi:hypothetical protein